MCVQVCIVVGAWPAQGFPPPLAQDHIAAALWLFSVQSDPPKHARHHPRLLVRVCQSLSCSKHWKPSRETAVSANRFCCGSLNPKGLILGQSMWRP